jgi:hypothetical protein
MTKARTQAVLRAREGRVSRAEIDRVGRALGDRVQGEGLGRARVRSAVASAPLEARLALYQRLMSERGIDLPTHERALRGAVDGGQVVERRKTFFEVTPASLETFRQTMGEGIVWFAVHWAPAHLHTLIADQNGGPSFTHNTYGKGPLRPAEVQARQVLLPVQLTGPEMERFVRFLNTVVEGPHPGGQGVYGFRSSDGQFVCRTACTNWATSAPVGELHSWIRDLDGEIAAHAKAGELPAGVEGGLHAALSTAPTAAARRSLVQEVLASSALADSTRTSVRRLTGEFEAFLKHFPNRPPDLIGRASLAETLGLRRSQDPAKWSYDLFMSERVPVIAIAHSTGSTVVGPELELDFEIMGKVGRDGVVHQGRGAASREAATR